MQLPDPILNLQIPDGVALHGGSRVHAASTTRFSAEQAAAAIRDQALNAAQEAYRTALVTPQLARESAVEHANITFAAATAQALSIRESAIATANAAFEIDPTVITARNSREATIAAANLILIAAIREQVIVDANIAYDLATTAPRAELQNTIQTADNIFSSATQEARAALDSAIADADAIYNQADEAERVIYDAAELAANNVFNAALSAAKAEYENTISVPRPVAATVGLMVAIDPNKALNTVLAGDTNNPVKMEVSLNSDSEKPFLATIKGDEKNPVKIDLNLNKLPKGKLRINGIDIGFYLFSWRIFSIRVKGEAQMDDPDQ
jgi:hypothetical protein